MGTLQEREAAATLMLLLGFADHDSLVLNTEYLCISNTIPAFQYRLICHTSYIRLSKTASYRFRVWLNKSNYPEQKFAAQSPHHSQQLLGW